MSKILQAVEVLQAAKSDAEGLLIGHPNLAIRCRNSLDSLINFFNHTAGAVGKPHTANVELFPPITNFMGEKILQPKEIRQEEVVIGADEKERFKTRVKELYDSFPSLENEAILKGFDVEPMLLRGVAKLAGVEGFIEKTIDFAFLDEIRAAMAGKVELAAAEEAAKKQAVNPKKKKDEGTGE